MIYRTKPVEVLAFQFTGMSETHLREWPDWAIQEFKNGNIRILLGWDAPCYIDGSFNKELYPVYPGNWIIQKQPSGRLLVRSDKTFQERYERV